MINLMQNINQKRKSISFVLMLVQDQTTDKLNHTCNNGN